MSISGIERWSATENIRISVISSPQNSTRTGCSAVGAKMSRIPPRTANSPRRPTISTRVYASSTSRATTPSKGDSSPTVSVRGSIMPSCGVMGCSSERTEVTTTPSGGPSWASSGWASRRSAIRRVPTVSTPGESRSCGSVSQDGNNATASPNTPRSSAARSSASRPVAVTTSNGPCRASALATNSRALAGAMRVNSSGRPPARCMSCWNVGALSANSTSPAIGVSEQAGPGAVMMRPF
ncbi:Uncharacterised protein [Mycobacterium tuberculosis]|nr:Uncharacterised protein [Mycobacterium tuberculosis]CNL80808.1 Uncharacterised protein [Mycobacterium tuberculosis]CNL81513.1 Uncharacterised protein [Mycobacterium tuberculosis]